MPDVRPIPEGMHTLTPHLVVQNAADAIEFYKKAFGAEEVMRVPGPNGSLVHAALKIGDSRLFLCDEFPGMSCASPQRMGGTTVTVHMYVDNVDAVFGRAVAAGAKVKMPLENAFWGDRFGKLSDPFGHEWSLAQQIEELTTEEMMRRAEEFNKQMAQQHLSS